MRTNTMVVAFALVAVIASAVIVIDDGADAATGYEITDVEYSNGVLSLTVPGIGDAYETMQLYATVDNLEGENHPLAVIGDNLVFRYDLEYDVEHTIKVRAYGDSSIQPIVTGTFTISSEPEPQVTGIEVTVEPAKTEYVEGEALDLSGMVVTATYDDGSSVAVDGYTTVPSEGAELTVDDTTVTVTYGGHTATFTITVSEKAPAELTGITVAGPTMTTYTVGESLDLTGLVVIATYDDGSSKEVTGYVTSPADGTVLDTVGSQTVTVSYTEGGVTMTATFTVTVEEESQATLEGIEVTTLPKAQYFVGDEFDSSGMVVTASYSDGKTRNVTGYTIDPEDGSILNTAGSQTVTVSYTEGDVTKMTTFTVTVEEPVVTGIEIVPVEDVYVIGDAFDATVAVYQVYNNGDKVLLESGYDVTFTQDGKEVTDGQVLEETGKITITVTYQTFTATFDVTVRAPGDVAISVTVIGGGPTNKVVITVDGVETEFTRNGTLVVEEGSVVTVAYSTSGLLDPTITVGGEPISNGGTFVAGSDTTLRVVFFVDDDDDNPVNPPVVATGDDDDDVVYAVAIAAGVIVAVFVAVYVIYGRKD